jgi:hypothetical protein
VGLNAFENVRVFSQLAGNLRELFLGLQGKGLKCSVVPL